MNKIVHINDNKSECSPNSFISQFDPTRQTVGSISRQLKEKNTDAYVQCGDLTREMTNSLVDDINDTIASNPYDGEEFYITVYEKKDLQMKETILRRLYVTKYRPYPEDDTIVFHVEPKTNNVKFCWCLPHHTEMDNVIINFHLYEKDYVNDIKAWKNYDLKHFGFDQIKQVVDFKGKKIRTPVPVPSKTNNDYYLNRAQIQTKL